MTDANWFRVYGDVVEGAAMTGDYYRVNSLVKQNGVSNWRPGTVLRIAKRDKAGPGYGTYAYRYFVTSTDAEVGFGCWLRHDQVQPLSPLELLASQAD